MHRPHVCEQGAPAGHVVTKREVWDGRGCEGPKRNNIDEKYRYGGHLVLEGRFHCDHRPHGWGVCPSARRSRRDWHHPK